MQKQEKELRSQIRRRLLRRTQILRISDEAERERKIQLTVNAIWDDFQRILEFQKAGGDRAEFGQINYDTLRHIVENTLPWDDYFQKTGIALSRDQKQHQRRRLKKTDLNPFVAKLGVKPTLEKLESILIDLHRTHPQIDKIISVGSGSGYLESNMESILKREKIDMTMICIDPKPDSYNPTDPHSKSRVIRPPDYPTIDDYLATKPPRVSQSLLFLNWPEVRKDHGAGYDIDAIKKLNPDAVLLLIELDYKNAGGAGSAELHAYRDSPDIPYTKKVISSFSHFRQEVYDFFRKHMHERLAKLNATGHFLMELWIKKSKSRRSKSRKKRAKSRPVVTCLADVYFAHNDRIDLASFLALVRQIGDDSIANEVSIEINRATDTQEATTH
jgi:hypothetical protein